MTVRLQRDEVRVERNQAIKIQLHIQKKFKNTLELYKSEKARASEFLAKYKEADTQRIQYLTLYSEAQEQLKFERRSKAGIRSWETRRKNENEHLKQEIAEMIILLRESLARRDEAISKLYGLAERMDKIQKLVDLVESGNASIDTVQKLRRIWVVLKDILGE